MNKLLSKVARLVLGLSLAAGVGVAIGSKAAERADAAQVVTNTITFGGGASNSSYTSTFTETDDASKTWTIGNFNNNGWGWSSSVTGANKTIKCGRKNNASVGYIQNSAALSSTTFTKVDLYITALTSGKLNNIKVYGGATAGAETTTLATVTSVTTSTSNPTSITLSNQSAYSYYKIAFDMASGSSNGLLSLDKVCWYQDVTVSSYSITYDANSDINVDLTNMPANHTGLSNGATQTLSATGPSRWGYTFGGWSTSSTGTTPTSSVTINGDNVTVYAIWTPDLTVTGAHASNPYTVAQARSAIDAGNHLKENYVAGKISQIDSYDSTYKSITYWISDDGTTTNQLQVYGGKGLNNADFSGTTDLRLEADVVISGTLKKYNSTYEFDKNSYQVSYTAPTTYSVTYDANGDANVSGMPSIETGLSNGSHNLSAATPTKWGFTFGGWAATDSSTTPITSVTISGSDVTVYAIWNADLTVKGAHASNPYTVAEARSAIDAGNHLQENYVSGKVSQVDSYNSTYHSVTYWISDDGTTTNQLEAYSGKGLNKANFSSKDDVEVGASVVICGTLTLYNSTYEFGSNNYQVSYTAPASLTLSSIEISGTLTTDSYATDEAWSPDGLIVTATYSDSSTANVTTSVTWSYNPATPAAMGAGTSTLTITAELDGESDDIQFSVTVTNAAYLSSTLVVGTNPDTSSWVDSTRTESVTYQGFTYTASAGGNNGKYYNSNTSWRLYQGNSGTLTISSTLYLIHSITVTYAINNTGILVYNSTQYASGAVINTGDVNSVTFGVGNTTSATNGQVQVQSILVKYSVKPEIDSISISGSLTKSTYEVGVDNAWSTSGLSVTLHYLNGAAADEDVTNDVSWSFDPATPSSTSTTSVEFTATYTGEKTLTASETYSVTVNAYQAPVVDGTEYILAYPDNNYYFTGIVTAGSNKIGQATSYVAFAKTDCPVTAVDNGDGTFSFETTNSKYLTWSSGNTLNETDSITANSKWNVTKNNDGTVKIQNSSDTTRYLQFNTTSGQQRFATYTGGQHDPSLIEVDNHALAGNFVECYMHPEIAHNPLDSDTGACKSSGNGYYDDAHDAYVLLDASVKSEFASNSDFVNYVARLTAWASANGYTFDPSAGTFVSQSSANTLLANVIGAKNTNTITVIVIISLVSVTAIGGYFFVKRRQEN